MKKLLFTFMALCIFLGGCSFDPLKSKSNINFTYKNGINVVLDIRSASSGYTSLYISYNKKYASLISEDKMQTNMLFSPDAKVSKTRNEKKDAVEIYEKIPCSNEELSKYLNTSVVNASITNTKNYFLQKDYTFDLKIPKKTLLSSLFGTAFTDDMLQNTGIYVIFDIPGNGYYANTGNNYGNVLVWKQSGYTSESDDLNCKVMYSEFNEKNMKIIGGTISSFVIFFVILSFIKKR